MGVYADVTEKKLVEMKLEKRVKQINALYQVYEHARMAKSLNSVLSGIAKELVQAFPHSENVQSKLIFDGRTYSYPKKLKRFVQKVDFPLLIAGVKRGHLQVGYNKKVLCLNRTHSLKEEKKLVENVAQILCKHMHARGVLDRYKEIIKRSFTAIIIVRGQKIAYVNPRFFRMFKCSERQVIGRNIRSFLPNYDTRHVTEGRVKECGGKQLKGEAFDVALINQRISYHGKPAILIRVNDISDLKKAQGKLNNFNQELKRTVKEKTLHLEEANKRLQSLNLLKDEFIAITSHELRSPLTSIRGYLSFLVEEDSMGQLSEPYREYLIRAYSTTDALNYLINNILDVSRLDMGRFQLQKQETDIIRLTRNILDSLSFQLNERRLQLEFENATKKECIPLMIDSIRISQVLRNILDNSIKFTKRSKKIRVTIKQKSRGVVVSVADQGVGIPKAKLDQIFDKFMQVKNTQTKYKGGVGLGLFIAKRIVELHGGKIQASKNNDGGTTVNIQLPL
jgi:PAS domain S-box-containing protein